MSLNQPKVSVIIPNFNYGHYLPDALKSVQNQTYTNIEIIVVDDGSYDASVSIVKLFKNVIILQQENLGVSFARNFGMSKCTGDYIAFLDADDVWDVNKVEKQINSMLKSGSEFSYTGIYITNSDLRIQSEIHPRYSGAVHLEYIKNPSTAVIVLGSSTAIISRKLFHLAGFFDTGLSISADWEYFFRCSVHAEVEFIDQPLTFYRIHGKNMSQRKLQIYYKDNWEALKKSFNYLNEHAVKGISNRKKFISSYKLLSSFIKSFRVPLELKIRQAPRSLRKFR
jgi:glycosyltransferase involved in cell wall biosynthesis